MSRRILATLAMTLAVLLISGSIRAADPAPPAAPGASDIDLSSVLSKDDAVKAQDTATASQAAAGQGDGKEFNIETDSSLTDLSKGDVYASGAETYFTVDRINSAGEKGGTFVLKRTNGASDPDRKFNRVTGKGPLTIVARQTLLDIYLAGGPFLHPLAVLAVLTILLAANSLWLYRTRRQVPTSFVNAARSALKARDLDKFTSLANSHRGLFPNVCRAMTENYSTSNTKDIERRCEVAAAAQINRLRIPVKALNLIAAAAPLLGLLGTIIGMVIVFEAVASANGAAKAEALAAGIRVKLFSTASALLVAIPALFLFWIFNQKLNNIISKCEVLGEEFLHEIRVMKRKRRSRAVSEEDGDDDGDAEPAPVAVKVKGGAR